MAARRLNASLFADRRYRLPVGDPGQRWEGEQELVAGDEPASTYSCAGRSPLAVGEADGRRLELEPQPVPAFGQCVRRAHLSSSGRQDLGLLAFELSRGDDSPVAEV